MEKVHHVKMIVSERGLEVRDAASVERNVMLKFYSRIYWWTARNHTSRSWQVTSSVYGNIFMSTLTGSFAF